MKNRSILLIIFLIMLNSVFGDEIEDIDLGESVVSATGYKQLLKDAPASMSIITKEELTNRPIRDLGDALQNTPGISTSVSKTGSNSIMMRGLSSSYSLILIDGKRQNIAKGFGGNGFDPTSGFMPPTSMIERIEIIRGPASVIYGSDALGGVINIITKKNPNKTTGSFSIETRLQEHNDTWGHMYGFNGYMATPIVNNILSFNLRARYNTTGANKFYKSDIKGYTGNKNNPYTSHSPTGYTIASIGGRLNYTINYENNFYIDSEFNYQNLGTLNTSSNQITAIRDYYRYDTTINHDANYDFGDFNTYLQFANTQQISRNNVKIGATGRNGTPNRATMQDNKILILNSMWNNDYDFNKAGILIANAGLYYMYEQFEARPNASKHQNQISIFGETEYIPIDLLSTTFGLRLNYSDLYKTSPNPRFYINLYPLKFLTIKTGIASGMSIPQLSYLYDGYTISGNSNEYIYGNKNLQAEKSWNYELSFIVDINPTLITITGYYTDFRDKIDTINYTQNQQMPVYGSCGGSTCSLYQNVEKALSSGVELALQMKRIYGVGFDLSYTYAFTKQLNGKNKGAPLNTIPRHNASAKISYKISAFDIYMQYTGKYKTPTGLAHSANSGVGEWFKDVHLFDLGLSYKFNKTWNLGFVINNLFDTNFVDYVVTNDGSSYTNLYQRMIPSRNYWINLKAEF